MISGELYVCLMLTAPLYGAFTALLFPVARPAIVAVGLFWLIGAVSVSGPESIFFGSWLGSAVEESLSVLLEFRVDRFSAYGIGAVGVCLLAAPFLTEFDSGRGSIKTPDRHTESAPLCLTLAAGCGLACTATDLSVLVVLWLLLDVTLASRFRASLTGSSASDENKTALLQPLQMSSLLLIVAVLMVNARYGTLRIEDHSYFRQSPEMPVPHGFLEAAAVFDRRVDAQSARFEICVVFALAACCRAAFLPWLLWQRRASNRSRPLDLIVVPLATLIPACVLLVRLSPLAYDTLTPLLTVSLVAAGVVAEPVSRWLFSVPLRVASKVAELFDRHLMGGSRDGAWLAHCQRAVGNVEHLRSLDPRYAALAAVLCLVGLLLALTGTRG